MSNIYKEFFKVYGIADHNIETVIKIGKAQLKKEIDIIVESNYIMFYYRNTLGLPKFTNYHKDTLILDYNITVYIKAMYIAIEKLILLSTTKSEESYLRYREYYLKEYELTIRPF